MLSLRPLCSTDHTEHTLEERVRALAALLARRITTLEQMVPRRRLGRPVPDDPIAFARGLLTREFGPEDIDPTNPNHAGWLTRVVAFLTTLTPEHRAWEKEIGVGGTGTEPVGFDALNAVMRRG